MSQIEELKKLLEDLHKPFAGMTVKTGVIGPFAGIEIDTRKLEVKCVCQP
jgi:hypothetical protein